MQIYKNVIGEIAKVWWVRAWNEGWQYSCHGDDHGNQNIAKKTEKSERCFNHKKQIVMTEESNIWN
jgi:hypothetical protein